MRIVHVIDYFHTDVGYQEYYLAKSMAEAGHEVTVLTSPHRQHTVHDAVDDDGRGERELMAAGATVIRLRALQLGHDRTWISGLSRSLGNLAPDAVHCHGPFSPTTVRTARVCRSRHIPLLVDNHMHDAIAPGASSLLGRSFYATFRATAGPLLRAAVGDWVANGPYEASFLEARLRLAPGQVALVPLGFDPAIFHPDDEAAAALRSEHGWGDDLVVAVTGKIHARKRPELTAAACERVLRERPVRLVIAGAVDADSEAAMAAAAPRLHSEGRVTRLSMLDRYRLAALYQATDVVVFARLPSISIYEAAGAGARVLCGQDKFSDWLAGFGAGVESVDAAALGEHLVRPADRPERAAGARKAFAWSTISNIFVHRYQDISCVS